MAEIKDVIVRIQVEGSEKALGQIASIERSRAKIFQETTRQARALGTATAGVNAYAKGVSNAALSEKELEKATRIRNQGTIQLGQQFQDFAVQIQGGQRPLVAFTQQAAQAGFIASQMGGSFAKVGAFIAGPWGTAIIIATALLTPFIEKMFSLSKATVEVVDEFEGLTKTSALSEIANKSLGDSIKDLNALTGNQVLTIREKINAGIVEIEQTLKGTKATQLQTQAVLDNTKARLEQQLAIERERVSNESQFSTRDTAVLGSRGRIGPLAGAVGEIEAKLKDLARQRAVIEESLKGNYSALAKLDADAAGKAAKERERAAAASERAAKALAKESEALREYAESLREAQDPFIAFNKERAKIIEARDAGFLSAGEASTAIFNAFDKASAAAEALRYKVESVALVMADLGMVTAQTLAPSLKLMNQGIQESIGYFGRTEAAALEAFEAIQKQAAEASFPIQQFADDMGRAVEGVITGAVSIKQAIGSMVGFILKELAKVAIAKFVVGLFAADGAAFNSGGAQAAAKGATFDGHTAKFARGGIVNSPTSFAFSRGGVPSMGLMGEAGPEAIMPLKRDKTGKLGVSASGINIQIINNAGASVQTREGPDGSLQVIIEQARRAIAADLRRGGNIVSTALEGTYGVNRGRGAA